MERDQQLNPDVLLEEYGDYLFRFAMLKLQNTALAEDMVQETLIAAIASKARYMPNATVRTWLTAIMKNKMIDHWRRLGREISATDLMESTEQEDSVDDFFDRAGRWADRPNLYQNPEQALENKQFWGIFETCVSRLKPQQAEVFLAREVHGMENEEISKSFALSPGNVWVLIHRARVALGKCLEIHWKK